MTLETSDQEVGPDGPANFVLSIRNEGATTLSVLSFDLPVPELSTPIFTCDINGQEIPFIGYQTFLPEPTSDDYEDLLPGEGLQYTIDMAEYCDISVEGTMTCFYEAFLSTILFEGEALPIRISSNAASVQVKENGGPVTTVRRQRRHLEDFPCTSKQIEDLGKMEKVAEKKVCDSLDCLSVLTPKTNNKGNRYFIDLFGPQTDDALKKVTGTFNDIKSDLTNQQQPTQYCCPPKNSNLCQKQKAVAAVKTPEKGQKLNKNDPNKIYICERFFDYQSE